MKNSSSEPKTKRSRSEVHPSLLQYFVDASYKVLINGLYIGITIETEAILHTKSVILRYYQQIPPEKFGEQIADYLSTFCRKVAVSREIAIASAGANVPHPCIWVQRILLQKRPESCSCGNCTCGLYDNEEFRHDETLFRELYGSIEFYLTPVRY